MLSTKLRGTQIRPRLKLTLDPVFMPSKPPPRYQLNVAAIVQNAARQILICERVDNDGAWQFPQGSVEKGESEEAALKRELWEEIGLPPHYFRVVSRRGPYRYLYGNGRQKKGFDGKEQHYFLVQLTKQDVEFDLEVANPEFQKHRWIRPEDFREKWLPFMKRSVYRQVFDDFFGINISSAKLSD